MTNSRMPTEDEARAAFLAATNFANEVAWKRPDLEILREEYRGQYSILVETVQEKILMSHERRKLVLPNLAAFGNNVVGVFSDYGGEHKDARYYTYSILVCTFDLRVLFSEKMSEIRDEHNLGSKEIAYKDFRMGQMLRALPDYLLTLDNYLPGFLLTLAVQKRVLEESSSTSKEARNLLEEALTSIGVEGRKSRVNEKLARVVELVAFLTALLGKDGQKVFWMTDQDEISPTLAKHEETLKAFDTLLRVFCRDNQTFSLVGGALPFEERDMGMLDMLSATDICAGSLAEYLTQREMNDPNKITVKPGCEHVLQWLGHDGIGLKKMNIVMREADDGSIGSAAIEFVPDNPPENVTIIPISV